MRICHADAVRGRMQQERYCASERLGDSEAAAGAAGHAGAWILGGRGAD